VGDIATTAVYVLLFIALYFEVFLLITFFEHYSKPSDSVSSAPRRLPSVTIMVPCYNEEQAVTRTVLSLLRLDYPKDKLTIFIIDDGSTDSTQKVLKRFRHQKRVRIFHKENGGKHTALNLGLEHVTTDLVGCLDADSYVEPQALREIVKRFGNPKVMCVTPAIKLHAPGSIVELIQQAEYALSVFIRKTFAQMDSLFITPGPFSIFRREVFEQLGNYREAHHTEDMEIALRMQMHHYKIENAPEARVYTNAPKTFRTLFRQRLRWTYGFIQNARDYRFLFFKRKYGHLGMFILPMAFLSIFPALFFSMLILESGIGFALNQLERVRAVGFILPSTPSFDLFFINTHSVLFLVYSIILATLFLIMIGKCWSADRPLSFDIALYLLCYGFLAPWWLGRAVYDSMRSKRQSWTREIDARKT
jgi:cellulose synthase/poly-beta-1,6-N-acetylglucosamine synthase-like glycosyltransferase